MAAYRTGQKIECELFGKTHDYSRRSGVVATGTVGPYAEQASLWNATELSEVTKRGGKPKMKATIGREANLALPAEASTEQRQGAVEEFAAWLREEYGVAAAWAIHLPGRGSHKNHHAHVMWTSRQVADNGAFGAKTRALDELSQGRVEITKIRAKWSQICQGIAADKSQWDHRSYAERGIIDKIPTQKLGVSACAIERATGNPSRRRLDAAGEQNARERHANRIKYFEDRRRLDAQIDEAQAKRDAELARGDEIEILWSEGLLDAALERRRILSSRYRQAQRKKDKPEVGLPVEEQPVEQPRKKRSSPKL